MPKKPSNPPKLQTITGGRAATSSAQESNTQEPAEQQKKAARDSFQTEAALQIAHRAGLGALYIVPPQLALGKPHRLIALIGEKAGGVFVVHHQVCKGLRELQYRAAFPQLNRQLCQMPVHRCPSSKSNSTIQGMIVLIL